MRDIILLPPTLYIVTIMLLWFGEAIAIFLAGIILGSILRKVFSR